jgi:hypothetical protein
MAILRIFVATFAATSLMTGFSYLMSAAFNKLYKEPVLLKKIMSRLGVDLQESTQKAVGWILHYFIGLLLVIAYDLLWTYSPLKVSWISGLVLGALSGLVGIAGWMIIFRLPDHPPGVHFKEYYLQLFFAHVVFGITVVAVYKLMDV